MSGSDESQYSEGGWIQWFCSLEDHNFFCEVDEEYIRDNFNLYGLRQKFTHYNEALEMILSPECPDDEDLEDEKFLEIYQEATDLYGLIHARFILSPKGLAIMREKFLLGKFGVCPRVLCERQAVLPIGMSEELRTSRVKVYCPRCEDVYIPKKKCTDVDGAYFGCSFPHILLQTYPDLYPNPPTTIYIPRIYGFKIHKKKGSKYWEGSKNLNEITHYGEEQLKKLKALFSSNLHNNQGQEEDDENIKNNPAPANAGQFTVEKNNQQQMINKSDN
jgi:casein kinase II subunit beta